MDTHSVEKHLKVTANQYDEAIRAFVPYYDEMLKTGVDLIRALAKASPKVLDLGGGTGALTQSILRGIPNAKVEIIDIDPYMLSEAKKRLGSEEGRVKFVECSFLTLYQKAMLLLLHCLCIIYKK